MSNTATIPLQYMRTVFGNYYEAIIQANITRLFSIIHMWYSEELPTDDRFDLIDLPNELKVAIFCKIYLDEILHYLRRASFYYELRDDDKHAYYLFQICFRIMYVAKYSSLGNLLPFFSDPEFSSDFMLINFHVFKDYYIHHKKHIGVGGCNRMDKFLNDVYKIYTF